MIDHVIEMKCIDLPEFVREFSRVDYPEYPSDLSFWKTLNDEEKAEVSRKRPDLWKSTEAKTFLDSISAYQSKNSKNRHWLKIFERECREEKNEPRLTKVMACLATYHNIEAV